MISCKEIPPNLLTKNILNSKNYKGESVWYFILLNKNENMLQKLPLHLIEKDLLDMKKANGENLFDSENVAYVEKVLQMPANLNLFMKENPYLAKQVEFRDPRLKLIDAKDKSVVFNFEGTSEQVILNKDGVTLSSATFDTLSNAVSFY